VSWVGRFVYVGDLNCKLIVVVEFLFIESMNCADPISIGDENKDAGIKFYIFGVLRSGFWQETRHDNRRRAMTTAMIVDVSSRKSNHNMLTCVTSHLKGVRDTNQS